eukprot:175378-Chlamydomonas_euryale.AAC.4
MRPRSRACSTAWPRTCAARRSGNRKRAASARAHAALHSGMQCSGRPRLSDSGAHTCDGAPPLTPAPPAALPPPMAGAGISNSLSAPTAVPRPSSDSARRTAPGSSTEAGRPSTLLVRSMHTTYESPSGGTPGSGASSGSGTSTVKQPGGGPGADGCGSAGAGGVRRGGTCDAPPASTPNIGSSSPSSETLPCRAKSGGRTLAGSEPSRSSPRAPAPVPVSAVAAAAGGGSASDMAMRARASSGVTSSAVCGSASFSRYSRKGASATTAPPPSPPPAAAAAAAHAPPPPGVPAPGGGVHAHNSAASQLANG